MNGTTISTLSRNNFNQLLESQEDTKRMITVEETNPSTHVYQQGNYLIYNNQLYKVTAAINIGDTLSTLTNISLVNVGEELKATTGSGNITIVSPPEVTVGTYTYDGTAHGPTITGLDTDNCTVAGATSIDAGTHQLTISLSGDSPMLWSDETVNAKIYSYTIARAVGTITTSTSSITVNNDTTYVDVTITTNSDGTLSMVPDTSGVVSIEHISGDVYRITGLQRGSTIISVSTPATLNCSEASTTISVTSNIYTIYGVTWSVNSSPAMTRTNASANFLNPSPAVNNGAGSSPFDNCWPWSGMVKETTTNGVFVKIPKFWYKMTANSNIFSLQIADAPLTGYSVSPAHLDRGDGVGERDYVYVARYKVSNSSGATPTRINYTGYTETYSTVPTNFTSYAFAKEQLYPLDYATYISITMLYLVEFASWDSQSKLGVGGVKASSSVAYTITGGTDAMQYHTGTSASSRTTAGNVQYRWIEDLYTGGRCLLSGIGIKSGSVYVTIDPSLLRTYSVSNSTLVGSISTTGGWIKYFQKSSTTGYEWCLIPVTASAASGTSYITDYYTYDSNMTTTDTGQVAIGYCASSNNYGLFFHSVAGCTIPNAQRGSVGIRVMHLPS